MELEVPVPEKVGRKVTFGAYSMEDLMRGGAFLIVSVALGYLTGNLIGQVVFALLGIFLFWLFGLVKVDGMAYHQYLKLRIDHIRNPPFLGISQLKIYEDGIVYNGVHFFKILEVTSTLSLDFMSRDAKEYIYAQFRHLLSSCPFPLQFIVHSWRVHPDSFDRYINAEGELAEGYRRLIYEHTRDLYLQSYYIVPIAMKRDVRAPSPELRYKRASEILSIYEDRIRAGLKSMGIGVRTLKKPAEIYSVIDEIMRGE